MSDCFAADAHLNFALHRDHAYHAITRHAGHPLSEYIIKAGTTYKFFVDHVGSVRQVMNVSNGTIAQELTYDEFGRVLSDSSPGFQPFGFAGGLYDSSTKLVQFGTRWYDAEVGRWLSKDPILFAGGDTNLYGYVLNDPINYFDPTGLNSWTLMENFADMISEVIDLYSTNSGLQTNFVNARRDQNKIKRARKS